MPKTTAPKATKPRAKKTGVADPITSETCQIAKPDDAEGQAHDEADEPEQEEAIQLAENTTDPTLENTAIWGRVFTTKSLDHVTPVEQGRFKYTAIDAYSQFQEATILFGPHGYGWGVRDQKHEMVEVDKNRPELNRLFYEAILWYRFKDPETGATIAGEFPISSGIGYFKKTKDGYITENDPEKKVKTDAITKGLSMLGFNGDVFLGRFDDNKYYEEKRQQERGGKSGGDLGQQHGNAPSAGKQKGSGYKPPQQQQQAQGGGQSQQQATTGYASSGTGGGTQPVGAAGGNEANAQIQVPVKQSVTPADFMADLSEEDLAACSNDAQIYAKIDLVLEIRQIIKETLNNAPSRELAQDFSKSGVINMQALIGRKNMPNKAPSLLQIDIKALQKLKQLFLEDAKIFALQPASSESQEQA